VFLPTWFGRPRTSRQLPAASCRLDGFGVAVCACLDD
jgi:hypothetical protein